MNAKKPNHWGCMRTKFFLLGVSLSVFATASSASIITNGTFSIAGTIFVTSAAGVTTPAGVCPVGISCIFFADTGTPAQNGKIDIAPFGLPNGDIPLAISGNDAANMFTQFNPPEIPPTINPPVPLMSFLNAGINTVLELTSFPLGINGAAGCLAVIPAAGQVCTPPGSPFNLQNLTATSSTVTFKMGGVSLDGTSVWTGIFASQFNNIPFQTVLNSLATNGFAANTFSGQITLSAVPEPGSLSFLLLGSGMIASATLLRKLVRR
uniref:Uncharacterized protein n=1 Tax=Solibacter usitatus (strain Ellin6076) TaxID=234267 RepID=Q026P2_SOLUE